MDSMCKRLLLFRLTMLNDPEPCYNEVW